MAELRAVNEKQKQKHAAPRSYITTGGVLTGAKGQQRAQEAIQLMVRNQFLKSVHHHNAVIAIKLVILEQAALLGLGNAIYFSVI
jgi:hypothetical protein